VLDVTALRYQVGYPSIEAGVNSLRVVNKQEQCIGYRLNIIGVRVYRDYCQLAARSGDQWLTVGPLHDLPVIIPTNPVELGSDPLLLTAYQYEQEKPGSDLRDVLAGRKDFDAALNDSGRPCAQEAHAKAK
jgi:hypothetical protein